MFDITRATVNVPTVISSTKDGDIMYLQLETFDADAAQLFNNAVIQGLLSGDKGMVLDLRDDPGGYLDQAVDIAGWFVNPAQWW